MSRVLSYTTPLFFFVKKNPHSCEWGFFETAATLILQQQWHQLPQAS